MADDILAKLDRAWDEDHKMNLMHYCDLAGQEIRRLRGRAGRHGARLKDEPPRSPEAIAADLRGLAENLWGLEYRVDVDADAALLIEAAEILEKHPHG